MRRLVLSLSLVLILATACPAWARTQVAKTRASTVFGRGPEIHLLPSFGPKGTRVTVVGLGYQPGVRVRVLYGPPNSEFVTTPLATAVVDSRGRFQTSFVVHGPSPPRLTPLIIGGLAGSQTAMTAFIITPV